MLNNLPGHSHRLSGERSVMSQPHPSLDTLIIDDLMEADLPAIAWSGGPGHLRSVARYLARAASGEVEYLAVRTPDGRIVAKAASTTPSIRATAPCCSSPPIPPVTATVGCSSRPWKGASAPATWTPCLALSPTTLAPAGSTRVLATPSAAPKTPPGRPPTPAAAASRIARP